MRLLLVIFLLGCATRPQQVRLVPQCPAPLIGLYEGQKWETQDADMVPDIQRGCKRRYGNKSCAKKITKVRTLGYQVVCYNAE